MADKPTSETDDDQDPDNDKPDEKPKPKTSDDDVEKLKAALRKANKEAEQSRLKLKELEDRDKSESDKLADRVKAAEERAEKAEAKLDRLEVALEKGLTASQAKRLVGTNREELEADADELLESFPTGGGKDRDTSPPKDRPRERLRGGGEPEDEPDETDPRKLAAQVPRY